MNAEIINIIDTAFFGIVITVISYLIGIKINQVTKNVLFNPLLIAIAIVIVFLVFTEIDYEIYNKGGQYFRFLLTPATVCFAIPLYRQFIILKSHLKAVLISILSGCIACTVSIIVMGKLMNVSQDVILGLMSKSVTLSIALDITNELGGMQSVTCVAVIITGILGGAIATTLGKIYRIKDDVSLGVAVGTASHAVGTARILQHSELAGAMGSLAIVVAGILTVFIAPLISRFY